MTNFGPSSRRVHERDMSLRGDLRVRDSFLKYVKRMRQLERIALFGELAVQKAVWSTVCAMAAFEGSFVVV